MWLDRQAPVFREATFISSKDQNFDWYADSPGLGRAITISILFLSA